jgi:clavulanate-9-aldehyde reducatase
MSEEDSWPVFGGDRALAGQVALVTGASSGIGAATARALHRAGAGLVLVARRLDRLHALADSLMGDHPNAGAVYVLGADLSREQDAAALVSRAVDKANRLDILINNAGVMILGDVAGADPASWRAMIEVNLVAALHTCRAALPVLVSCGGGHIVNISATAGRRAYVGMAVYGATKHALCAFSASLHEEARGHRVKITTIEPGAVDTELSAHMSNALTPKDVAAAVLFAVTAPGDVVIQEMMLRSLTQPASP